MFATLEGPAQRETPQHRFDSEVTERPHTKQSVKTPKKPGKMSRVEIVETALRTGFPLHRVEEYFDWLDMSQDS